MNTDTKLNYIEMATRDMAATKHFFTYVFNWYFSDYGPDYSAFFAGEAGLDGGFYSVKESEAKMPCQSILPVFYSPELEKIQRAIKAAGGVISREIFAFPGGRRFHFIEPGGNELAVWSEEKSTTDN